MDEIADAAERRLEAAAYVAVEAGFSDERILQIVRDGMAEARRHAAVRAADDDWGSQMGTAA